MKKCFKVLTYCGDRDGLDTKWFKAEFLAGRLRVGWSWPGSDLRKLEQKPNASCTPDELLTWRKTQFLIRRIEIGDWVVCQFERPIREFWVGEVIPPAYEYEGDLEDFNHVLRVQPLSAKPFAIDSSFVSWALRHDLSKPGNYYQIYADSSVQELESLVELDDPSAPMSGQTREIAHELRSANERIILQTVSEMKARWKSTYFEQLCREMLNSMTDVQVQEIGDTGLGWDLLIDFLDPITGDTLMEGVPVQCKALTDGEVYSLKPIDDLERCIRNSRGTLAYLMIMGDLTPEFREAFENRKRQLSNEMGRPVDLRLLSDHELAMLYLKSQISR